LPDELRLAGTFLLAAALTYPLTLLAIEVARRTGFLDRPGGAHKGHAAATPYLGGLAILVGTLVAVTVFGVHLGRWWPVLAAAAVLCALGTLDDRRPLPPVQRVLIEALVATALWALDLGWMLFGSGAANLALTIVWFVAVVNAFNLFDNMDGAVGCLAVVCCAGLAADALIGDHLGPAVLVTALAGAALTFLRFNLARPARIFLGDGGSMAIGAIVATVAMASASGHAEHASTFLVNLLLVGVPVLETALVTFSRLRRGVSPFTPGRDHLSHRLLKRYPSPRRIAIGLATAQAVLSALALIAGQAGTSEVIAVTVAYGILACVVIVFFETPSWAPARPRSTA
jgi:UDP-GlcNAc:undecaprenyl-phosphate/decaprenyl-phosphate GlcNAc-1-phosphate transferase